jgi:hypothetical protein
MPGGFSCLYTGQAIEIAIVLDRVVYVEYT